MITLNSMFADFMEGHFNRYPFNEVLSEDMDFEYLLFSDTYIQGREYVKKASDFSESEQMYLLMTGLGLPLTPIMDLIKDAMDNERECNNYAKTQVYGLFRQYLISGKSCPKKEIYTRSLATMITSITTHGTTAEHPVIYETWLSVIEHLYEYNNRDFIYLINKTISMAGNHQSHNGGNV